MTRGDLVAHPAASGRLATAGFHAHAPGMRLFQDEIYQKGNTYIRIIRLDRYEVEFKQTEGDPKGESEEQVLAKKEFCRLIRGMTRIFPVQKEGPPPKPKG